MTAVQLLRCDSYEEGPLKAALAKVFGHWGKVLPPSGAKVLLKPNMVKALPRERQAQTDPVFLATVAELCMDLGHKVIVSDSPAIGSVKQALTANGALPLLERLGVQWADFKPNQTVNIDGRTCHISKSLGEVDAVINCPKLKGHGQLYYTGAVKNCFGCLAGKRKVWHHMHLGDQKDGELFAQMLVDHALAVSPTLNILDGVMAMAGKGPIHGSPVFEGLIAASDDPFALDLAIMKHLGADLHQDPVQVYLTKMRPELVENVSLTVDEDLKRGDFFFPGAKQRKPISFRPWVLARLAFRSWRSKWSS